LLQGKVREEVISIDTLARASRVFLVNSVRGMHEISPALTYDFVTPGTSL